MANPTFYSYTDSGAPVITRTDPAWLGKILDACLVTGYASKTAAGWTSPYSPTAGTTQGSIYFDRLNGAADTGLFNGIQVSPSATISAPGTGDYTLECWVRWESAHKSNNNIICLQNNPQAAFWGFFSNTTTVGFYESNTARCSITTTSVSVDVWHHLAVARESGVTRMFLDGTQAGSSYTASTNLSTCIPSIGCAYGNPATNADYHFGGYMGDCRYIVGTALYTTSFSVPTTPLSAVSGTKFLILPRGAHRSTSFTDSSTSALTFTPGSAYISNQIPDPYGVYNPSTTDFRVYQNNTGRGLTVSNTNRYRAPVEAYNALTSITSGTGKFLPRYMSGATYAPCWPSFGTSVYTTETSIVKWSVAATNDFFYLIIDVNSTISGTSLRYNSATGAFWQAGYTYNPEMNLVHCFGTISKKETPIIGIDSIFSYEIVSAVASAFKNSTMNFTPQTVGLGVNTSYTGLAHNALNSNYAAVAGVNVYKVPPFRSMSMMDTDNTNSGGFYDGKATVSEIIDKNKHLTFFMKLPISTRSIGNDYTNFHFGEMPGLYILTGLSGERVAHWQTITITKKDGTPLILRAVKVLSPTCSGDHIVYINEGDWA